MAPTRLILSFATDGKEHYKIKKKDIKYIASLNRSPRAISMPWMLSPTLAVEYHLLPLPVR